MMENYVKKIKKVTFNPSNQFYWDLFAKCFCCRVHPGTPKLSIMNFCKKNKSSVGWVSNGVRLKTLQSRLNRCILSDELHICRETDNFQAHSVVPVQNKTEMLVEMKQHEQMSNKKKRNNEKNKTHLYQELKPHHENTQNKKITFSQPSFINNIDQLSLHWKEEIKSECKRSGGARTPSAI